MSHRPGCSLNRPPSHARSTSKKNVFKRVPEREEAVAEVGVAEPVEHRKAEDKAKDKETAARAAEGCDSTLRRPEFGHCHAGGETAGLQDGCRTGLAAH